MGKPNIVLIGLSGCGKTTFAKRLGARYRMPVFDMDKEIVRQAGKSVAEIFAEEGEQGFRDGETAVAKTGGQLEGTIMSTGGGVRSPAPWLPGRPGVCSMCDLASRSQVPT